MKIAIYSSKGSAGKTPISTNIALDKNFCVGTNEAFHIYDSLIEDDQLIALDTEEPFPSELKDMDVDIVFDLAGSISKLAVSITSALTMSDVVIVPIYNEYKSLVAGLNTIHQIQQYNQNIIVVATKLQKGKRETFTGDWRQSSDYQNIANAVHEKFPEHDIPVLPLKFSKVFDSIFEQQKSIQQMMAENPLAKYSYRDVAVQFEDIYQHIGL
ncbi:ParA family protein [Marinomonas sp. 2405UD66-6]|uniref:ParA family protein n=1 Tax=Marinomonas sp. 2405UD66-6 TaxID=3391834 RepID=UPI0039C9B071